jgi:hypothetical protein
MRPRVLVAAIMALTVAAAGCASDPTASDEYRALEARLAGVRAERDAVLAELYAIDGDGSGDTDSPDVAPGGVESAGRPPTIAVTPVEWGIVTDEAAPGVYFASMIVDVRPVVPGDVDRLSGRLVWDDVSVELCGMSIREPGDDFVRVGDIFGSGEGCFDGDAAMQDAFDRYGLATKGCLAIGLSRFELEYCAPLTSITLTPMEWEIVLDDRGEGIHTIHMIVDSRPLTAGEIQDVSARLVWEDVEVDLCGFHWDVGDGSLVVGDVFQTTEGCYDGDTAMQDAFDSHGPPETACVAVRVGGVEHQFCSPLG